MAGLKSALLELRNAGCRMAYINGSFVTDKEFPEDYDGCWDMRGVDIGMLDPTLYDVTQARKAQKDKYFGEFFCLGLRILKAGPSWNSSRPIAAKAPKA